MLGAPNTGREGHRIWSPRIAHLHRRRIRSAGPASFVTTH
ncbi:hypothetical protein SSAG_01389 [Streptomyces sp. Mg1]|nr:hypothetical protein SSAG_01389 [Streptomyces sp. Mg1]